MNTSKQSLVALLALLLKGAFAFTSPSTTASRQAMKQQTSALFLSSDQNQQDESPAKSNRRSFMAASTAALATTFLSTTAAQAKEERQGIEVTPFNGLIFNYRNSQFGGLDATTLNEPSISYAEFCDKLKAGEVEFVEFIAPDGDAAYATLKSKDGGEANKAIRIGEGYPTEQHDGWSSPAFAVRTVKNAGVPYKFVVPALAKYKS